MNRTNDAGLAILRIGVGGVFVAHGLQKLFVFGLAGLSDFMAQAGLPFPALSALAVTATELLGGLALVAGFQTRLAALPLAFAMLVAALAVHLKAGFFLPDGIEYVLVLFLASVTLALTGPGAWAVDTLLRRPPAEVRPLRRPELLEVE